MSQNAKRPQRRMTAEEHLEQQRQQLDRSSLDLENPENMLFPHVSTVHHIPVELHQDIANWFRRLGDHIPPSERYAPAESSRPTTHVDLPADIVAWFARDGREPAQTIELVLQEFIRSVEATPDKPDRN